MVLGRHMSVVLPAAGLVGLLCCAALPAEAAGPASPPPPLPHGLPSAAGAAGSPGADGAGSLGADGAGSDERPEAHIDGPAATTPQEPAQVGALRYTSSKSLAPGVAFQRLRTSAAAGPVRGGLLVVNLRHPRVSVRVLRPDVIAARRKVSAMVTAAGAVAGVNGDFFEMIGTHPGIRPTGSSSGPMVDRGRALKAAVPYGQRFGPLLPLTASPEDVIGVGADRRGRVARLRLAGSIRADHFTLPLSGLNQYALPVGGAGVFTRVWGRASRRRAVCGTDLRRGDGCSVQTAEVTVRRGVVTRVRTAIRGGAIPRGTTVMVGRDEAALTLLTLRPGDRVRVRHGLTGPRLRFAVGGSTILRDGRALAGLDQQVAAPRTAAGVSRDGHRMYLAVIDGRSKRSGGLTLAELALLLGRIGADDAVNLDGGGSSTLVARGRGKNVVRVRNRPSDGGERAVSNGIGIFSAATARR